MGKNVVWNIVEHLFRGVNGFQRLGVQISFGFRQLWELAHFVPGTFKKAVSVTRPGQLCPPQRFPTKNEARLVIQRLVKKLMAPSRSP